MRLLVTGGSGFLGGYVLDEARRRGHEIVALARSEKAAAAVTRHGAQPLTGDFDDPAGLPHVFSSAGCSSLLNIASLGFGHAPAIVAAAREAGLDRALFVSTTAVTTRLPARSRAVRLEAEKQIRESGLKWTILRPTMIYGASGDRNLSRLLMLLPRVPVLPVPGGGRERPPAASPRGRRGQCGAECGRAPESAGKTYDVAGPEPLSFAALVHAAARAAGSRARFVPVPLGPLVAAARAYELLCAAPRIRAEQLQRLAEDKAFSIDDAARDLGYAPRPFTDGILAEARALGLAEGAAPVTAGNLPLLARTAAHLQPGQITQRARLRAQRTAMRRFPARYWLMADPARAVGWPARFSPLDARIWRNWPEFGLLRQGRLDLLGMTRTPAAPASVADDGGEQGDPSDADWAEAHWTRADWQQADWEHAAAPGRRFHLHYWDWAWRLASEPDRADTRAWFAAMWQSWHAQVRPGRGDAWLPYPAALRAWAYCGLHLGSGRGQPDRQAAYVASLSAHAGFPRQPRTT